MNKAREFGAFIVALTEVKELYHYLVTIKNGEHLLAEVILRKPACKSYADAMELYVNWCNQARIVAEGKAHELNLNGERYFFNATLPQR